MLGGFCEVRKPYSEWCYSEWHFGDVVRCSRPGHYVIAWDERTGPVESSAVQNSKCRDARLLDGVTARRSQHMYMSTQVRHETGHHDALTGQR